ncbi:hypothetical protein ACOMHN_066611 [Nucella lapillus]
MGRILGREGGVAHCRLQVWMWLEERRDHQRVEVAMDSLTHQQQRHFPSACALCATLYQPVPICIILCHPVPWCDVVCHPVPWCAILCRGVPSFAVVCHPVPWCAIL